MKWVIAVGVSLLLVVVCVIYFRRDPRPVVVVVEKPASSAKIPAAKPTPLSPVRPSGPIDISGPLKDRALVSWVLPQYPEWAEEKGVVGVSILRIRVTPSGKVQSFIEVMQLAGDPRLDEEAIQALRQWQFAEKANSFGEQWGFVTIRFALLDKNSGADAEVKGVALGKGAAVGAWQCVRQWIDEAQTKFVYICRLRPSPKAQK